MKMLVLMEEKTYDKMVDMGLSSEMTVTDGYREFLRNEVLCRLDLINAYPSDDIIDKMVDELMDFDFTEDDYISITIEKIFESKGL